MTACLITTNYPPVGGGVSRYNYGLVHAVFPRIVLGGWDDGDSPPSGEGFVAKIKQLIWAQRIVARMPRSTLLLISQPHLGLGLLMTGRPFVQFVHGGEWENYPAGRALFRLFLAYPQKLVFNSVATMERLKCSRRGRFDLVLKPGLSEITPVKPASGRRSVGSLQKNPLIRVLAVSRLSRRKGHRRLIAGVERCRAAGLNIELTVVGSGELQDEIGQFIEGKTFVTLKSGLSDAELRLAYDRADIFALLPEQIKGGEAWEGFGIVYLEAAARGLPILATDTGGVREATCQEGALLLSEACTETDIAESLHYLSTSPIVRLRMSEANLSWAAENTWSARAEVIGEVFATQIGRGLSGRHR